LLLASNSALLLRCADGLGRYAQAMTWRH
jgi:hypothetical protein